jgi:hypothetical protein
VVRSAASDILSIRQHTSAYVSILLTLQASHPQHLSVARSLSLSLSLSRSLLYSLLEVDLKDLIPLTSRFEKKNTGKPFKHHQEE